MKKKIGVIIGILLIIALFFGYIISYANTGETIYLNLKPSNTDGIGYGIGDPKPVGGAGQYIWNITTYDSATATTASANQRNLYCIKANYGATWQDVDQNEILAYNLFYDLDTDKADLLTKLTVGGTTENSVVIDLLSGTYSKQIMWILNNMFVEGETDKAAFLEKVGIKYDEQNDEYYYEPTDEFDYTALAPINDNSGYTTLIENEDIKAVQKAAIWYYTNNGEDEFNKKGLTGWLTITTDSGNSYENLGTVSDERNEQAIILYNYLIDAAEKYKDEDASQPVSVETSGLTQDTNGKYKISTTRVGANYITGPIILTQNNNGIYDISLKINGNEVDFSKYTFTDENGNSLNTTSVKDLVGRTGGFYISYARNSIDEINIEINVSYNTTQKTLWLQGTEDDTKITLAGEQPVVEIHKINPNSKIELVSKPEEFDLSLRKYIIGVTNSKGDAQTIPTRAPVISVDTLQTGTTATYKHRKDPVVVEDNSEVTYAITIFNEGNKAGYATQIVDQLPTGLISSTSNPSTIVSKDRNGNAKNTYILSYNTTYNRITFDIVDTAENPAQSLNPYLIDEGLDYETLEIKCKVTQEPDTKNQIILTNVAWINIAYDSEAGKTITNTVGDDRDSEPSATPSVNRDTMQDYKGNNSNKDDLSDSNYFYEGQQDDDDFEKLVIMPVVKKFDLALFKHIAAISKDQTIEDGEYITDTGNKDGTYLRAPVVTNIDAETGKITYQEDTKAALVVEPGDYVLYTIRVYNEGEVDGYASEIKDTLPIGLEFVVENTEYNGIWNLEGLDEDERQVVTTTWYAKGQGAELNSSVGDANYTANLLKALNKEGAITDENPDYIDAQVLCKVVEQATSDRVLVNYAQISDDSDSDGNPVDDVDSTPDEWIDEDDDQDIERIKLQCFDLSLRKFITAVDGIELKDSNGKYTREPVVDVTPLVKGTDTTAIYTHPKTSVSVQAGSRVVYTIRVYNEGDIAGFANEVKDYLPPYLEYIEDSEINKKYGWTTDGRIATTTYLSDKEISEFKGTSLDYEDIQIECKISDNATPKENITNIAEISEYKYGDSVVPEDVDSESDDLVEKGDLPEDKDLPSYKEDEIDKSYVPGNEDDDDFEKVYVKEFDLALRKFITQIGDEEVTSRVPKVKYEDGKISYEHPKDPITLHVGDVVIYTLRIYNEGEIDGYAKTIRDDIPEYLEYLPEESTNVQYMWKMYDENDNETENVEEAKTIKTEYLSKENGTENLLKAFDGSKLYYKDIKVAFKVKDPNSNSYIITNSAQIADDTDSEGNPIKDRDSKTDEWNDGEDDQDIENVKVEYFDLSLLKFVSKVIVIEDGKENILETGYNGHEEPEPVVKVELHRKKLNEVTVKFGYGITITNEGDIPGYATEITDYVPEGLKFVAEDNPEWTDEGNNVISTKQLETTLLQPGESKTIEVILTWINGPDNLALKTNTAEISEDKNEYDVPDRDSTPDNQKEGEDDIDIAKVILGVSTGRVQTYFGLTLGLLTIVLVGVTLIKKYVI